MKYIGSIVLLVLTATLLSAATVEERVKAALGQAVVTAKADCSCGAGCTCVNGECGSPNCPSRQHVHAEAPGPVEWAIYKVQYAQAVAQNKPLIIWVGETCPACERQWSGWVHARLSEYDSPTGQIEKGPCVIVGKPDALGGMDRVATLKGIPDKAQVDAALGLQPVPLSSLSAQPAELRLPPARFAPPMMAMGGGFGGFGGGGSRGGC